MPEKHYLCRLKFFCMNKFHKKYKQTIDTLLIILFWIALSLVYLRVSVLRPYCVKHPYKELLSEVFDLGAVAGTRWIAFPCLFQKGHHTAFWLVSAALLFLSVGAELLLVNNELTVCNPSIQETSGYMSTLTLSLLARNTGIFSFRMLFALQFYYEGRIKNSPIYSRDQKTEITEPETNFTPSVAQTRASDDLQLDNRLREVLEIIGKCPGQDTQYIIGHLPYDISQRSVERCLSELRKQGLIEYSGSKKTGGYHLTGKHQNCEALETVQPKEMIVGEEDSEKKRN